MFFFCLNFWRDEAALFRPLAVPLRGGVSFLRIFRCFKQGIFICGSFPCVCVTVHALHYLLRFGLWFFCACLGGYLLYASCFHVLFRVLGCLRRRYSRAMQLSGVYICYLYLSGVNIFPFISLESESCICDRSLRSSCY